MEPCSEPFPPPPPLPRPTGESSQRAGCPVERKERAEFWLERAARTVVQRTEGTGPPHFRAAWDQSAGTKVGFPAPDCVPPASSVQDLCAWPGETGDPRGYEATASFLFPWPHPIPLAGSQVQAPARTNDSQEGQRGGACDAARIPAPWGLNLPGSARALQQVLFVHGRHAASPSAPTKLRAGRRQSALTFRSGPAAAPRARPLYPRPSPLRVKPPAARRVQKPAGRGKGDRLQREPRLCPQH